VSAGAVASSVEPEIISLLILAAVTASSTILAVETVASVGVPADKELPNTIIKSMTSPVDRLDANVSVEPLTVNCLLELG
jgi:hypothetical protein